MKDTNTNIEPVLESWGQMKVLQKFIRFARKPPREKLQKIHSNLGEKDWYWRFHSPKNDRTAYIIGLYGSGREYINQVLLEHLGKRARYVRNVDGAVRLRRVRTSMVYSGHATIKHFSIGQASPAVTSRLVEAATSGSVDLIFIYRHPVDSLLTNWIWAWQMNRGSTKPGFVSQVYKSADDLSAHLDQNFSDFKAFADGDPNFFLSGQCPRFLSFAEFVEETELYLQAATLTLRLEDFMSDPLKEFSKIVGAMSVDLDLSRVQVSPPKTKAYRYLAIREKVPQFRNFINELDAETKRRIANIGYSL
jgi:hypothetical protein